MIDLAEQPALDSAETAAPGPLASYGYACVREVFSADEVAALRAAAENEFATHAEGMKVPADCGRVLGDLFRHPELSRRVFTPRLMQAVAGLLGPGTLLLPEHAVHSGAFGGWHKDTDMFERAGWMHHWQPDYAVWQCALYLQDNGPQTGGGLSVVPGSHREPRPRSTLVDAAEREAWIAARPQLPIPSRAGDLVVFDTRIDHRATPRTQHEGQPSKLALFFMAARDNPHASMYIDFIRRRADYAYLRDYTVPAEAAAAAAAAGLRFVA